MKFLRTASTGRLLAVLTAVVLIVGGGSALAVAASSGGPVAKPRSLAAALHHALGAHAVRGISANITFTNNLIDASSFQGSDPLLQGASGRLWLSNDHRLRLELQSANGDAQIVLNGTHFWISDPALHTVYQGTLPRSLMSASHKAKGTQHEGIPSIASIQSDLTKLMKHINVSGAIPGDVAGQAAYTVRVSPKHDGGLLGAAEVAWDAARGIPLRFALYTKHNPTPVLALTATAISYGPIPASDFNVAAPSGSKVVKISTAAVGSHAKSRDRRHRAEVSGVRAVAAKLPFTLHAPSALVGMPRQSVKLLSWGDKPAALVTFGQGLGGIVVIEQAAPAKASPASSTSSSGSGDQPGFTLPTVSIKGATGTELDTALGTVVRFSRGGVSYTVLGSVPAVAAEKAARSL